MDRTTGATSLSRAFHDNDARTLLELPDGTGVSYAGLWRSAGDFAARLAARGAKRGDRLLISLESSEHVLTLFIACARGGFVACPVDPELPARRLDPLIALIRPAQTIASPDLAEILASPEAPACPLDEGSPDDDFLVILSSGTTGEPKGIVHSLRSIVESAASFGRLAGLGPDTVVYHHFPMFYMAGIFNLFFSPLLAGSRIVLGPTFSSVSMLRFWDLPIARGVNHLTLTPTMAHSLCHLYRRDDRIPAHLARYQAVISTGAPLYPATAERFLEAFGVPLRTCYGVTEVGGTVTHQSWEDAIASQSMGTWAPETDIRTGTEDAPSEILVRTPFMMKGYLRNDGLEAPFDDDGFFRTGDHGFLKEGRLYFSGRDQDLVKKGGEFISIPLVESEALRCDLVAEVAVVAVEDEFWGRRLVLFYLPQQGADEKEILSQLESTFSSTLRKIERPDKVIPVPWMPKTSVGKVVKRDLLEKYTIRT